MLKTKITDLDQDIEDIDQEVLALNDQYHKFRMEKNYYVKQKRMKETSCGNRQQDQVLESDENDSDIEFLNEFNKNNDEKSRVPTFMMSILNQ